MVKYEVNIIQVRKKITKVATSNNSVKVYLSFLETDTQIKKFLTGEVVLYRFPGLIMGTSHLGAELKII